MKIVLCLLDINIAVSRLLSFMSCYHVIMLSCDHVIMLYHVISWAAAQHQEGFDGRGQQTASPMLTAIMSGGVGISGRE